MGLPNLFKLKPKGAGQKNKSGVTYPLSLSIPLPYQQPSTKPFSLGSTDSLLPHIFVGSMFVINAIFAKQLLSWRTPWPQKKNIFLLLWTNVTCFVLNRFFKGKELSSELWGEIGKRLVSRLDILRFRSVCKKFRACLACPSRFPLQVPPPPSCNLDLLNVPFVITELTIYRGWGYFSHSDGYGKGNPLFCEEYGFEEVDRGGKYLGHYLRIGGSWNQKFTSNYAIQFMEFPEHPLSQIKFVSKAYRLRMALPQDQRVFGKYWDLRCDSFAKKVVLISSDADGVNPSYVKPCDLSVVALLNGGKMKGRLALLRLGGSTQSWKWDISFCTRLFEDIATFGGRLCTIDLQGRVFLMDYNSLKMTQISSPLYVNGIKIHGKHLFEDCGHLYLADRTMKKLGDDGFKLDFRRQNWCWAGEIRNQAKSLLPFLV